MISATDLPRLHLQYLSLIFLHMRLVRFEHAFLAACNLTDEYMKALPNLEESDGVCLRHRDKYKLPFSHLCRMKMTSWMRTILMTLIMMKRSARFL